MSHKNRCVLLIWMEGDCGNRMFIVPEGAVGTEDFEKVLSANNIYVNTVDENEKNAIDVSELIEEKFLDFEITTRKVGDYGPYYQREFTQIPNEIVVSISDIVNTGILP